MWGGEETDRLLAAAPSTGTPAEASRAEGSFLRLVDPQRPAIEHDAVELGDRVGGVLRGTHRDEGESADASGVAVGRYRDVGDGADGEESCLDGFAGCIEREIADVETITHVHFLCDFP